MSGAIPPLPQYAFIAWCSVKAQGQLYLYLLAGPEGSVPQILKPATGHDSKPISSPPILTTSFLNIICPSSILQVAGVHDVSVQKFCIHSQFLPSPFKALSVSLS
jgi:hypothetical protein